MIFRLLAIIALLIVAYFLVKSISRRFTLTPRQNRILFMIVAALLVVGILIVLGRLPVHFLIAPLGAVLAFVLRFLPTLLRLLPMWQMFKGRVASAGSRQQGQASTIRTEYLAMELAHDSGDMDGIVLKGSFSRRRLSDLNLQDLIALHAECGADADSAQVLQAYLDRRQPDWREQAEWNEADTAASDEAVMSRPLALEILGLEEPVDKKQVTAAHRQLMRKLHPDRGGSDYLAKKINSAKDYLLQESG